MCITSPSTRAPAQKRGVNMAGMTIIKGCIHCRRWVRHIHRVIRCVQQHSTLLFVYRSHTKSQAAWEDEKKKETSHGRRFLWFNTGALRRLFPALTQQAVTSVSPTSPKIHQLTDTLVYVIRITADCNLISVIKSAAYVIFSSCSDIWHFQAYWFLIIKTWVLVLFTYAGYKHGML